MSIGKTLIRKMKSIFYVGVLVIFSLHFLLTLIYVSPPNPIKTVTNLPNLYIGNFFPQEWAFFSPEPGDSDYGLSVQCIDSKVDRKTRLLDVMSGLWHRHQRNRFSPYDRIQSVPGNHAFAMVAHSFADIPLLKACAANSNLPHCEDLEEQFKVQREASKEGLVKVASAFCADVAGSAFDSARLVVWEMHVQPWSQRYSNTKERTMVADLGISTLVASKSYNIWRLQ